MKLYKSIKVSGAASVMIGNSLFLHGKFLYLEKTWRHQV